MAAKATGLDAKKLRAQAESPAVRKRVAASTAEFHAHRITQRPAPFIIENTIGDKAVISGLVKIEPLAAAIDAMLFDAAAYAAHAAITDHRRPVTNLPRFAGLALFYINCAEPHMNPVTRILLTTMNLSG